MMDSKNGFAVLVECQNCSKKFEVSSKSENVHYKEAFKVNGQTIYLTYYDCPECGRRHFVQIDSDYTLDVLRSVTKQFAKLAAAKKQDKAVPQKQLDKFKRARQHLATSRMDLMKEYTGVSVHDEAADSDFVLEFSI